MGGVEPLIVGEMDTITCSTSVEIISIEWIDDMETTVASDNTGEKQLELVFNPVTDSIHNRMYTCRINATALDQSTGLPLEIEGTVNITVRGKHAMVQSCYKRGVAHHI